MFAFTLSAVCGPLSLLLFINGPLVTNAIGLSSAESYGVNATRDLRRLKALRYRDSAINIFGEPLEPCSEVGTAMTGFERTGKCEEVDGDAGSHHICIKMKKDFCDVTEQPNWCGKSMPCMGESGDCKIGNWCICQWAYAKYLDKVGDCESSLDLNCAAINQAAVKAYKKRGEEDALKCLRQKCPTMSPR